MALDEPLPNLSPQSAVGDAARRGMALTTIARLAAQVIQFASTIVLAHLLVPSEFGLVAITTTFTNFAQLFTDLGLGSAIIHFHHPTQRLLSSAFWLNAITGVLLTGLLCALAVPIAGFYNHPELAPLLIIGSFGFTLSLSTVQLAILERTMRFRAVVVVEFCALVIGQGTSVSSAYLGLGAKGITLGSVVQIAVTSILMSWVVRWRPSRVTDRRSLRELWAFSSHLFGFNAINYWSRNLDNILIGKFKGAAALGTYNYAYALMLLPVNQVTTALGRVMFPALARIRDDPPRLRDAYNRIIRVLVVIGTPLAVGLSVSAHPLIVGVLGQQWAPAAPVLTLLALSIPAQIVSGTSGPLYRAIGDTKTLLRRSLVQTAITVVAISVGLLWGTKGVALLLLIKFYLLMPVAIGPAWKAIGLTIRSMLAGLGGIVGASLAMALAMWSMGLALRTQPQLVILAGETTTGLVVYLLGMRILAKEFCSEFVGIIRQRRPSSHAPDGHPRP